MEITQQDTDAVLAILAANPKASTQPTLYSDVLAKSGFTRPKLNLIKKDLLAEGKIREEHRSGEKLKLHLLVPDKRQQIIDLISRDRPVYTSTMEKYTGLKEPAVHDILLQLAFEGLVEIRNIMVRPSEKLRNNTSATLAIMEEETQG